MDYLSNLENQSIYIMREALNKFENMAMLWSIGKDSTVLLWLARKAFFGHVPFPLVHVDTTYKIPSMIEYRDKFLQMGGEKLSLVPGLNDGDRHAEALTAIVRNQLQGWIAKGDGNER